MGSLSEVKTSPKGKTKVEIDVDELILRLKSLVNVGNIEIVQLALQSMLDEILDSVGDASKKG
jgi:hypothetical protein